MGRKVNALVLGLAIVIIATQGVSAEDRQVFEPLTLQVTHKISLGKKLPLDIRSSGVEWENQTWHLLELANIQFLLDRESRFTAEIEGDVCHFDNIDYTVYCAVFDASGTLLGTASVLVQVKRIWRGIVISEIVKTFSLDFGISTNFRKAKYFAIAISERKVLTLDMWQK